MMAFLQGAPSRRDLAHASLALAAGASVVGSAAAADGDDLEFKAGDHPIDRDQVIRGTLTLSPGARLLIRSGATLTLLGDLVAPCRTIFLGAGRVDLTRSRVLAARPEWWGASPDDPTIDCAPAIEAALAAHIVVQLGMGDYHLRRTLSVDRPNRRLWGVGRTNGERGTRLLRIGSDGAVVRVGTRAAPATINDYLRGIDLRWIEVGRTEAPRDDAGPTGVAVRYVLDCVFEGLRANEHAVGYSLRGAVRTLVTDCAAFRSLFPGSPADAFVGFDLDGTDPPTPTGANASLYLVDCAVRTGNRPGLAGAVGCRLLGTFSDSFLIRFETTQLGYGVVVDGGPRQQGRYAQVDLHLDTPVLDQCGRAGIVFRRLGNTAMIDVSSPWIAVAPGAPAAIHVVDAGGAIGVVGGQLVATGGGTSIGVLVERASGVTLAGTKLLDTTRPIVAVAATGFDIAPVVLAGSASNGAAVELAGCEGGAVRARLLGAPGRFATGVALDSACRATLVETVGLNAATTPVRIGATTPRSVTGAIAVA